MMGMNVGGVNEDGYAYAANAAAAGSVYKNDPAVIQKTLKDAVNAGNVKPLLGANAAAAVLSISALSAEEMEAARDACKNYSVNALFLEDRFTVDMKNNAGNYKIHGVEFSEEDFKKTRDFLAGLAKELNRGELDYRDYAKMGLAENIAEKFAFENLTEDQAKVVRLAMQGYNEKLVKEQNARLAGYTLRDSQDALSKDYYGIWRELTDAERTALEAQKKELSSKYGAPYRETRPGDTVMTHTATDKDLINSIIDTMKYADFSDPDSWEDTVGRYSELVKKVYLSDFARLDSDAANRAIQREVSDFMEMIKNAQARANYKAVDYYI